MWNRSKRIRSSTEEKSTVSRPEVLTSSPDLVPLARRWKWVLDFINPSFRLTFCPRQLHCSVTTQAGDTLIIGWPPPIATRLHRATGWSARQWSWEYPLGFIERLVGQPSATKAASGDWLVISAWVGNHLSSNGGVKFAGLILAFM